MLGAAPAQKPLQAWIAAWYEACLGRLPRGPYLALLALLHLLLLYLALRYSASSSYSTLIELALAPVHEGGHLLFSPFGEFMRILGGSLTQWLVPLLLVAGFVKQRDLYAVTAGCFLFGISLNQSFCYMDSSFQMEKYPDMVLVSLGSGEVIHDWQYLFGSLGMYNSYQAAAMATRLTGLAFMWLAWGFGAWILWKSWRHDSASGV
jgi:hypothetical protein